jgi:hypothetical protein
VTVTATTSVAVISSTTTGVKVTEAAQTLAWPTGCSARTG